MPVRPRARAARPAAWRAARREQLTTRCSTSTPARAAASGTAAAAANGCAATRARITGPASRAPAHDGGGQGGDGGDGSSGLEGSDGAGGGELHVTGLYLLSVGMNDTIPETLSALTRLESLVLSWNAALTGKLPRALFSSMPSLTTVQLDGTGFRGRLPPLGGAAGGVRGAGDLLRGTRQAAVPPRRLHRVRRAGEADAVARAHVQSPGGCTHWTRTGCCDNGESQCKSIGADLDTGLY